MSDISKVKRSTIATVLGLIFRNRNKTATILELRRWIGSHKRQRYNYYYELLNEGYIQRIEIKDEGIPRGEEIKTYQITPKGVQFHLEYKKESILRKVVFCSKDEITINDVKFDGLVIEHIETIQLVFNMLCQEGFLVKKTSYTDEQENAVYLITEKARKLQSYYRQKRKAKDRKRKAKELRKGFWNIFENHPWLIVIVGCPIVIVGGLIIGGILLLIISLFM